MASLISVKVVKEGLGSWSRALAHLAESPGLIASTRGVSQLFGTPVPGDPTDSLFWLPKALHTRCTDTPCPNTTLRTVKEFMRGLV